MTKSHQGRTVVMVTSWYPSRLNATEGNFVERHALALQSVGFDIVVVHLKYSNKVPFPKIEIRMENDLRIIHCFVPRYFVPKTLFRTINFKKVLRKIVQLAPSELHVIHGNVIYPSGELAAYLKNQLHLPLVITEHSSMFQPSNKTPYPPAFHEIVQAAAKQTDRLIPVSHNLKKAMQNYGVQGEFAVVNNAVDDSLFKPNPKRPDSPFTFLHISHFEKASKNTEGILSAFSQAKLEGTKLVIAGDGDTSQLYKHIENEGLESENIEILGAQDYNGVARLMRSSHCHVLFSNYENLPCVIAESHCCGVPVIATRVGGIPEMMDETNGIIIEPKDEGALADAFKEMTEKYGSYDTQEIANRASSRYGYSKIGEEFAVIYANCR